MTVETSANPSPASPSDAACHDGSCLSPSRALFGWSPPSLQANTGAKRAVDRYLPSTGIPLLLCYGVVIGLLLTAPGLPKRGELAIDGLAALIAGTWCALNFWRCRHAHCIVTGAGWLALAGFAFLEAVIGRSTIAGDEQLVFLAVLVLGFAFEAGWQRLRGTNALIRSSQVIRS